MPRDVDTGRFLPIDPAVRLRSKLVAEERGFMRQRAHRERMRVAA
jgi:hypothetical protein